MSENGSRQLGMAAKGSGTDTDIEVLTRWENLQGELETREGRT